jgi:hypothetical protein
MGDGARQERSQSSADSDYFSPEEEMADRGGRSGMAVEIGTGEPTSRGTKRMAEGNHDDEVSKGAAAGAHRTGKNITGDSPAKGAGGRGKQ